MNQVCRKLGVSRRKACKALGQARSTQRYECKQPQKDRLIITDMLKSSKEHRRYGYRRITIELRKDGWQVNFKRVYRLWRQEGLKIRRKQQKRRRLGTSENSCDRRRPEHRDHVWSYDFLSERLENGRRVRLLTVMDEYTRECLAIDVARNFKGEDVKEVLGYLFAVRGCPMYIRSDNGSEFVAKVVRDYLRDSGVKTLFIEPGSPWENGYIESFNGKLRDELLDGELFLHIDEVRYVVDRWRMDYNHYRPHSSLGYVSPVAFAATCGSSGSASPHPSSHTYQSVNTLMKGGT